ncbi:MAG TPA: hypothetical protein VK978_04860 [Candidatus Saccharimonadales bacterium]|nr:hypothetical protein [Candidatus Saccharimonadales bacterium]
MVVKADKTTKKIPKAASKPSKVFDVAKPGKEAAADATARPVIISHRPLMKDPMMSEAATPTPEEKSRPQGSGSAKVVIQPLGALAKAEDANAGALLASPGAIDLHIPDFDQPAAVPAGKEKEEDVPADQTPEPIAEPVDEAAAPSTGSPQQDAPEPAEDRGTAAAGSLSSVTSVSQDALDIKPAPGPKAAEVTEAAALEAEIKRQEAFEALVESKEYFLPINAVKRRRSRIVTVSGLLLIVLLGLLLVNLLMDVGVIRIEGVRPLTHFFGS